MKTTFKNFVKTMDEEIPEATTANFMAKGTKIMKDAGSTGICALATCIALGNLAMDLGEVGLMASKGIVKTTASTMRNFYVETPAIAVVR